VQLKFEASNVGGPTCIY